MQKSKIIGAFIIVVVIAGGLAWWLLFAFSGNRPQQTEQLSSRAVIEADSVRSFVIRFGEQLKQVSLLAPNASLQIQQRYAPYIADELLAKWMKTPKTAPGRLTSSPWPARIEINNMEFIQAGKVEVHAQIILMTSRGKVSRIDDQTASRPIILTVEKQDEVWQIIDWQKLKDSK